MDALTAVAIVAGTVASYAVAWLFGVPLLVPLLNTAASFPLMVRALERGDLRLAIARMLIWAMTLGVCATSLSYRYPAATDVSVPWRRSVPFGAAGSGRRGPRGPNGSLVRREGSE